MIIQILDNTVINEIVDFLKSHNLEDSSRYYVASHINVKSLTEVTLQRLIFEGQVLVYGEVEGNNIFKICIIIVPQGISKETEPFIGISNIDSSYFITEVLKLIKVDFEYRKWSKIQMLPLKCQITNKLNCILNDGNFKKEMELCAGDTRLNLCFYAHFFNETNSN